MDGEPHRGFQFGPEIIGLMGVAAGVILVALYHCLVNSCCCSQRRIQNITQQNEQQQRQQHQGLQINQNIHRPRGTTIPTTTSDNENEYSASPAHQLMPIFKYNKECKEGTCVVCLCEFKDGEALRALPECMHLFHVGCIDMWLQSHSNCPLCRTNILPPQAQAQAQAQRIQPQQHVVISMPNLNGVPQVQSLLLAHLGVV